MYFYRSMKGKEDLLLCLNLSISMYFFRNWHSNIIKIDMFNTVVLIKGNQIQF